MKLSVGLFMLFLQSLTSFRNHVDRPLILFKVRIIQQLKAHFDLNTRHTVLNLVYVKSSSTL